MSENNGKYNLIKATIIAVIGIIVLAISAAISYIFTKNHCCKKK